MRSHTQQHIGGVLTLAALQRLHMPHDQQKIDDEIRRLNREGLRARDIGEALQLPLGRIIPALVRGIPA